MPSLSDQPFLPSSPTAVRRRFEPMPEAEPSPPPPLLEQRRRFEPQDLADNSTPTASEPNLPLFKWHYRWYTLTKVETLNGPNCTMPDKCIIGLFATSNHFHLSTGAFADKSQRVHRTWGPASRWHSELCHYSPWRVFTTKLNGPCDIQQMIFGGAAYTAERATDRDVRELPLAPADDDLPEQSDYIFWAAAGLADFESIFESCDAAYTLEDGPILFDDIYAYRKMRRALKSSVSDAPEHKDNSGKEEEEEDEK